MASQYSQQQIMIESVTDRVWVMSDRHRLKQVIVNLIDNAVKYSAPQKPIKLKYFTAGDRVQI